MKRPVGGGARLRLPQQRAQRSDLAGVAVDGCGDLVHDGGPLRGVRSADAGRATVSRGGQVAAAARDGAGRVRAWSGHSSLLMRFSPAGAGS